MNKEEFNKHMIESYIQGLKDQIKIIKQMIEQTFDENDFSNLKKEMIEKIMEKNK